MVVPPKSYWEIVDGISEIPQAGGAEGGVGGAPSMIGKMLADKPADDSDKENSGKKEKKGKKDKEDEKDGDDKDAKKDKNTSRTCTQPVVDHTHARRHYLSPGP
eukprot:COSAG06_NODE_31260_length_524_cov_1.167059_1_plen_103_part_01